MAIIKYKTNRAARKRMSIVNRRGLYQGKSEKSLTTSKTRVSGRGSEGRITVRHRGGGAKRNLRVIDFGQEKFGVVGKVERIEYDPNRSAFIALMLYGDGDRRYVLAWEGARVDDKVICGETAVEQVGNRMKLKNITPGTEIFNAELKSGRGGVLLRAAGTSAILMDVAGEFAQLKMPSGEVRLLPGEAYATIGKVSNSDARLVRVGSAGRMRRKGRRPQVRGKAMNPVDHPHGGGEGSQPIGLKHPKTKWGKPALGVKTRTKGKYSDAYVVKRRKKKRK